MLSKRKATHKRIKNKPNKLKIPKNKRHFPSALLQSKTQGRSWPSVCFRWIWWQICATKTGSRFRKAFRNSKST